MINCQNRWPATKINDRHYFQVGGYGGITVDEYLHGGPRVQRFLKRVGSRRDQFALPEITGEYLEAEWGFDEDLLIRHHCYGIAPQLRCRGGARFDEPYRPIRPVADFYREWYTELGRPTDKLLIESFMLLEPYWCLRTGCIPYWAVFTGRPCLMTFSDYVRQHRFDWMYLTLFSNIVRSIGVPRGRDWARIIESASSGHALLGVDPEQFPFDLTSPFQFFEDVKTKIPFRFDLPPSASLSQFQEFLSRGASEDLRLRDVPLDQNRSVA